MANDNVIAVLGTGIMGAAMARNLLSAGMEVRVWNRSRWQTTGPRSRTAPPRPPRVQGSC
jgi:3-hydroxyisobutyrate dehydrogenase-like beta-hydroxyacid dehydrogenase